MAKTTVAPPSYVTTLVVWDIVEQTLSKRDLLKVGMILTLGVEDFPAEG